jgi:hypothetical protein
MTRYVAAPKNPFTMLPDYRDGANSMIISGYDYTPATANPPDETETYRPVTLVWDYPGSRIYQTWLIAVNGHRANRTYRITTPGATQTYGVMINGIHIPVQFNTVDDAKLFAQHIEDTNTED